MHERKSFLTRQIFAIRSILTEASTRRTVQIMSTDIDRTQPYAIRLPTSQSSGEMRVGWRSYKVQVVDISWQSITVSLPSSIASRLRLNSVATVWHQGTSWRTTINHPTRGENGTTSLSLSLMECDSQVHKLKKNFDRAVACGETRVGTDPLVFGIALFSLIVAAMVLPGFGDEMGTSDMMTKLITDMCKNTTKFFTDMF
jgi:hypothetical protein